MKQREVTNEENLRWTCVRAYTMLENKPDEKVEDAAETGDGKVTVVCTPSGGSKAVRLQLDPDWEDQISDEFLVAAINQSK